MKKVLFLLSLTLLASCTKKQNAKLEAFQGLNVENVTATDRQSMFTQYSEDYVWFETCILLNDYLDSDNCQGVVGVSNIFECIEELDSTSFNSYVVMYSHTLDTVATDFRPQAFWVGDEPLNKTKIVLTFNDAFNRLMEANIVKPHSRHCVLRKELGPVDANAQYVFGNQSAQAYVDAVTGEVSAENPVFKGFDTPQTSVQLEKPLGEWP